MHAVIKNFLDMQINKCNVISGYGKFWTLNEIFMVSCFVEKFFSDITRDRILIFLSYFRLYDKNSESDYYFFPPPKSEYFFQQHWESTESERYLQTSDFGLHTSTTSLIGVSKCRFLKFMLFIRVRLFNLLLN